MARALDTQKACRKGLQPGELIPLGPFKYYYVEALDESSWLTVLFLPFSRRQFVTKILIGARSFSSPASLGCFQRVSSFHLLGSLSFFQVITAMAFYSVAMWQCVGFLKLRFCCLCNFLCGMCSKAITQVRWIALVNFWIISGFFQIALFAL